MAFAGIYYQKWVGDKGKSARDREEDKEEEKEKKGIKRKEGWHVTCLCPVQERCLPHVSENTELEEC